MTERLWRGCLTRRGAVRAVAGFLAGSPLVRAQQDPFRDHSRVPGLGELKTTFDFEPVAYAKLPRYTYDYTSYGADGEFTLRRNREAFDWVDLAPRSLAAGGRPVSTGVEVLGTRLEYPIMVAPSAAHAALHPEAEVATCAGCAAASNTVLISSGVASLSFDKIAASTKAPLWYQLYPSRNMDDNRKLLDVVQSSGAKAIVVTVDQQAPVFERIQHDRNLQRPPGGGGGRPAAGLNLYGVSDRRLWYEWKMFDELRAFVRLPILIKGVMTAEDARLAVEHGLNGVYVSNHGGRSVDYEESPLEVLPEVVDAVKGRVPVLVDGGFRRGADILKALALGAAAVAVCRPQRWGLAAYGGAGVQRVFEILQAEFRLAMAATGRTSIASIDGSIVRTYFP
ncbi:MAG: alpha-hydroxy-acid oxidizing protein [Acidobacteria bacterium]|nr:alpha-hydroxy-acid oxidizing protein [Acidobacteriota bacterium]